MTPRESEYCNVSSLSRHRIHDRRLSNLMADLISSRMAQRQTAATRPLSGRVTACAAPATIIGIVSILTIRICLLIATLGGLVWAMVNRTIKAKSAAAIQGLQDASASEVAT